MKTRSRKKLKNDEDSSPNQNSSDSMDIDLNLSELNLEANNLDLDNLEEDKNPLKSSPPNIQGLPVEIRGVIFGYLTDIQKLIVRQVCSDWNSEISKLLSKTVYFDLLSRDCLQVALDSRVPWTKIRVSDFSFVLPTEFRNHVTTLQVDLPEPCTSQDLSNCMDFVIGFSELTTLNVNIEESKLSKPKHSRSSTIKNFTIVHDGFGEFVGKLASLSIKFPCDMFDTLVHFLDPLDAQAMRLAKLDFTERFAEKTITVRRRWNVTNPRNPTVFPISNILGLISQSSVFLKDLNLTVHSKRIRENLFPELVSKLYTDNSLHLESVTIRCEPVSGNGERDFKIHRDFLKAQTADNGEILSATLPWSAGNKNCSQDMMLSLPKNIKYLENVHEEHIMDTFLTVFTQLASLSITPTAPTNMFTRQCDKVRNIQIDCRIRRTFGENTLYRNLAETFSNLVELKILDDGNNLSTFGDVDLQGIIKYIKLLRVLQIEHGLNITDCGVTGISASCISNMWKYGQIYMDPPLPPEENMKGLPLSSLKMLDKLVLGSISSLTRITDVGIYFGLQFGQTMKQMSFGSASGEVCDWGLNRLGTGNSYLEAFSGSFSSQKISPGGGELLRSKLPLVSLTRKFKFVNIKS